VPEDESDEGYLYPENYFVPIELPPAVKKAFSQASEWSSICGVRLGRLNIK
jgi:hypothetical protein